ncbi:phage major capsid family protein [Bacteroides neonati]|uniref:phage major capsid family protein n=1 Tax=Bacteroides neonati TaxID=1347393 RepID=UPI0005A8DB81|nr:phage major capsid protein [Bacteroides neonati]
MKNLIQSVGKYKSLVMFGFIALLCAVSYYCGGDAVLGLAMAAPIPLIGFAKEEKDLTDEEKALFGTIQKKCKDVCEEFAKGLMSKHDIELKLKDISDSITESLKGLSNFEEIKKSYEEQSEKVTALAEAFDRIKENGGVLTSVNAVEKAVSDFLDTPACQGYFSNREKSSGTLSLDLKGLVSITDSVETPRANNRSTGRVVTAVNEQRLNLRDLMMVERGDPSALSISYEQVYDFDRNVTVVSENGMLAESSLKFKEEYTNVKRIGTHMNLSKRLLKAKSYVVSFILNRLPLWVKTAENYQILFGDGSGDNLKGITTYEGVECVSKFISGTYLTLTAGAISSLEKTETGQTIVTLAAANDKIVDKMKITLAGATVETGLNATFDIHKMSDRSFAIDFDYKGTETSIKAMTGAIKSGMFGSVEDPNYKDAINAIYAVLNFGQYSPNSLTLHPSTVFTISTAKDTTGRDLNLVTEMNGRKYIGSIPVVECNAMGIGKYFAGDMINGCSLIDYTTVNIEFADDVQTKLKNMTTVIIQEEVMMPVYMPWAFAYGDLDDVLKAIKKA